MSWVTVKNSDGFKMELEYSISNNEKGNYSTVTCKRIEISSTSAYHSVYNNYPTTSSSCAVLGFGVNGTKKTYRVQLGAINPNKSRFYDLTDLSVRVNHNSVTGKGSCDLSVFVDTKTNYGNCNWYSKKINLSTFDRKKAQISAQLDGRYNNSLKYIVKTTKTLSDLWYSVNNTSWIKVSSVAKSTIVTIPNLSPNTNYSIRFQGRTSINGLDTDIISVNNKTDANASTITGVTINSITTNSVHFTVNVTNAQNNGVSYYLYSVDNREYLTSYSNKMTINNLGANSNYILHIIAVSSNGKKSSIYNKSFKTDTNYPRINNITVSQKTTQSFKVSITGYDAQAGLSTFIYYLNGAEKIKTKDTSYIFTNLDSYTTYNYQVKIIDNKNREGTHGGSTSTNPKLSDNFDIKISDNKVVNEKYRSIKIQVLNIQHQVPIKKFEYIIDRQDGKILNFVSTNNTYIVNGLVPFTNYNVTVRITDTFGNSAESSISTKTLPLIPLIKKMEVLKTTPTSAEIFVMPEQSPYHSKVVEYTYKISGSDFFQRAPGPQFVINDLKPDTTYTLTIKLKDDYQQESISNVAMIFKTKEDKWIYLSVNGEDFKKVNIYTIFSNGKIKKIEKSFRKIIKE